jgi:DNA-binding XRE family transcriptional regulator
MIAAEIDAGNEIHTSGGRRRRSEQPASITSKRPHKLQRHPSQTPSQGHWIIVQYAPDNTCNHPCMASGKPRSPLNIRFGKRLGALRKEKKWTFVYLAGHSGLDESFLVRLEQGQQEPCLNTQDIIAKSFGLTISELMRGV